MTNDSNAINKEMKELPSVISFSKRYNLPENTIKPCIAKIFEADIPKGQRDKTFYMLSCELINNLHLDRSKAVNILLDKNNHINTPLPTNTIHKKIICALNKKLDYKTGELVGVTYGCNHPIFRSNCIGKSLCPYHRQSYKESELQSESIYSLINKGGLRILSSSEFVTYVSICKLERDKGIVPGNLLIATHRDYTRVANLTRQTIAKNLQNLHLYGLIQYKKGEQHKCHKKASEVIRVIPIPEVEHVKRTNPDNVK